MGRMIKCICLLFAVVALLCGCSIMTVDQMYALPKRSDDFQNLQAVIDQAMVGLEYCAPLSGEYQQTVQMADLDGDGTQEYLLFARGASEIPLRILIFKRTQEDSFFHMDTIEANGTAFDQVEYVDMDGKGGMELVVGRLLSDQVLRSVSVYSFMTGEAEQLVSANYTRFLTVDLDSDSLSELFVIRPGLTDTDRGIVVYYGMEQNVMGRSNEVNLSGPADQLKRIVVGTLHDGEPAVYVASAVGDTAIITDVYACTQGLLSNITLSNESGTSVQTIRNYYVYADDIDNDGVVELPQILTMVPVSEGRGAERHDLIRWYAMRSDGSEVDKRYTFHNFVSGWYMELNSDWAYRLSMSVQGNQYDFYLWDLDSETMHKLMTVYTLTGQNREERSTQEGRFVLHKSDSVIYSASLQPMAKEVGLTQESVVHGFHLIHQDWKTGEM